jgi:sialidase-1
MIMKIIFVFLFLISFHSRAWSQKIAHLPADKWKGFERINFKIDDHSAYYVKPGKPVPGNQWIWRASFPDWHTEMDSLLLAKGFFVAYISVDDQYGSPYAVSVWNKLYAYLTDSVLLSGKVSLEGVSRGGLYAYNWAKRNPEKVNCIYGEAPVCDFKSWPGGKGRGKGEPSSWKQLLQVYSMTESQALAYKDNPIDNLEALAKCKVPLLHVVSLRDNIVPVDENTDILFKRYAALGGPVILDPATTEPQTLEGHHFLIEHAAWWADFIIMISSNNL